METRESRPQSGYGLSLTQDILARACISDVLATPRKAVSALQLFWIASSVLELHPAETEHLGLLHEGDCAGRRLNDGPAAEATEARRRAPPLHPGRPAHRYSCPR